MAERQGAIESFLATHGYGAARRLPLAGDASARRYLRLVGGPRPALLMDAPPEVIDVRPFIRIAAWLRARGWSAPETYAADVDAGLVLVEDLGDHLFSQAIAAGHDERLLYGTTIDIVVALQREQPPEDLSPYDDAWLLREASLLIDWYAPDLAHGVRADYLALWQDLLPKARVGAEVFVYVDLMADNLLWLPDRCGLGRVGLLDFQDARLGPAAYDLISLLEDARRDVAPPLAAAMTGRYLAARPELDRQAFLAACAVLAAQRNCKILGLFTRLARQDGKTRYAGFLPRVEGHLRRDLAHPVLAPLRDWCSRHLGPPVAS